VRTLQQSFLRTKTGDYASFYRVQELRADSSNNTVYADADGTIAYFHGNFIPKRDVKFDFTHPVDGSDPQTEWQGAHDIKDTITLLNPKSGWVANTNNSPFTAAGEDSPKPQDYPAYMSSTPENARGLHAERLLKGARDVTLDGLIALGYDSALPAFDILLPPLFAAFERLTADDPRRASLRDPIMLLQAWDRRTAVDSAATSLAIFWGQALIDAKGSAAQNSDEPLFEFLVDVSDTERLSALAGAITRLQQDFGSWTVPWGEINRFQRVSDDVDQPFDDAKPSVPVGMASARWGALASFDWTRPRHTKRLYGAFGNSFVAAVEFGPQVHAKAISAGGESGDPASAHFADQIAPYSQGHLRDVWFYEEDVRAHAQRRYHPGE
jgi:acyl-homoserine-lactone acylase